MFSGSKIKNLLFVFGALTIFSAKAYSQEPTHSYINSMRSSNVTHYYVAMSAQGEFGVLNREFSNTAAKDAKAARVSDDKTPSTDKAFWQGYGIRNEVGVEFIKFLQFSVAHTSLNLRGQDSSQRLSGSRFEGGTNLTFYAPLGNLQMGGGAITSSLEYLNDGTTATYYGSGYYYGLGYNYFLSTAVSFTAQARQTHEHLVRNSGASEVQSMNAEMRAVSLGFDIWL